MKYYKVQKEKNYWDVNGKYLGCAIENELITEREMKKCGYPFTSNFMPVEIKKTTITKPNGDILVTNTTRVTGKGQVYFVNKFLFINQKNDKEI